MAATALATAEPWHGEQVEADQQDVDVEAQEPVASIEEMTGLVPVKVSMREQPAEYALCALWYVPEAVYGSNPQGYFLLADPSYAPLAPPATVTGPQLAGTAGYEDVQQWARYTQLAVSWADSAVGCTVEEVLSELRALAASSGQEQPGMEIPSATMLYESWHQSKQHLSSLSQPGNEPQPDEELLEEKEQVVVPRKATPASAQKERLEKILQQIRADFEEQGGLWEPQHWEMFNAKHRDGRRRNTVKYKGQTYSTYAAAMRAAMADQQQPVKAKSDNNVIRVTVTGDDGEDDAAACTAPAANGPTAAIDAAVGNADAGEERDEDEDKADAAAKVKAKSKAAAALPEPDGKKYARIGDGTVAKRGDATDYAKHAISSLQKEVEHQGGVWPRGEVVVHVMRAPPPAKWRTWFMFENEKYLSRNTAMKAILRSQRAKFAHGVSATAGKRRKSAPAATGAATGSSSHARSKATHQASAAATNSARAGDGQPVSKAPEGREGEGNTSPKTSFAQRLQGNEGDTIKEEHLTAGIEQGGGVEVTDVVVDVNGAAPQERNRSKSLPAATTAAAATAAAAAGANTRPAASPALATDSATATEQVSMGDNKKHVEDAIAIELRMEGWSSPKGLLKEWDAPDAAVHGLQLLKASLQQQQLPYTAADWQVHAHWHKTWAFSYMYRPVDDKFHRLATTIRLAKEHLLQDAGNSSQEEDEAMEDVPNKVVPNLLDLKEEDVLPPGVKRGRPPSVVTAAAPSSQQPVRGQCKSLQAQGKAAASASTANEEAPAPRNEAPKKRTPQKGSKDNMPASKRARASVAATSSAMQDQAVADAPAAATGAASSLGHGMADKKQDGGAAPRVQQPAAYSMPSTHAPEPAAQAPQLQHSGAAIHANGTSCHTLPNLSSAPELAIMPRLPSGGMVPSHHQDHNMAVDVRHMLMVPQHTHAPFAATDAAATASRLSPMPKPKVTGDVATREGQAEVIPALVKLLKELGCPSVARQLMHRMKDYYSGSIEGKQDFVMHYMSLWTAVDLQDEDYVKEVLREDWKLQL